VDFLNHTIGGCVFFVKTSSVAGPVHDHKFPNASLAPKARVVAVLLYQTIMTSDRAQKYFGIPPQDYA